MSDSETEPDRNFKRNPNFLVTSETLPDQTCLKTPAFLSDLHVWFEFQILCGSVLLMLRNREPPHRGECSSMFPRLNAPPPTSRWIFKGAAAWWYEGGGLFISAKKCFDRNSSPHYSKTGHDTSICTSKQPLGTLKNEVSCQPLKVTAVTFKWAKNPWKVK